MALHLLRCFALASLVARARARARAVVGVVLSHARQGLLLCASLLLTMQGVSAAAMPVSLPPPAHASGRSEAHSPMHFSTAAPLQDATAMPDCHQVGNGTADSTASGSASLPGGDSCGCDCLHALALPVAGLPALRPVLIGFVVVMPSLAGPAVNLSRELRPPISA